LANDTKFTHPQLVSLRAQSPVIIQPDLRGHLPFQDIRLSQRGTPGHFDQSRWRGKGPRDVRHLLGNRDN